MSMACSNPALDVMDEFSGLPGLTIAQLRNNGEAALRSNNYKEAIRAFDQALGKAKSQDSNTARLTRMALLDLRVEARLKGNQDDRACKDAETMVRLDRTDARGYIRLGQVKRLQGDRAAALKSYSTGLKRVLTTNPLRHVLETKYENTLRAITHSNPIDPVIALPAELLHMVLSHFEYREATALVRLSKPWRDVIVSLPLIQTTLDFSSRFRPISGGAFKACVRRLSGPPSVVIAQELSGPATRELRKCLALWIRLEQLELQNIDIRITSVHWSKSLMVLDVGEQQKLNRENVCKILSICSLLRRASFNFVNSKSDDDYDDYWMNDQTVSIPQMHSLTIRGYECGSNAPERLVWPTSFFNRYPNLEELCLYNMDLSPRALQPTLDFSTLSRLRSLTMERVNLEVFPALPPSLEVLKCRAWPTRVDAWPTPFPSQFKAQLDLTRLRTIQFIEMGRQILSPLSNLPPSGELNSVTRLDLYECLIGLEIFTSLLERGQLRELKSLRISFPDLNDDHLETFLVHCPKLETMVLTNTRITGVFVKGLITAPSSQVKCLVLDGVDSRVSFDAVEWAQKRGVDIHWNGHRYNSFGGNLASVIQA